MFGYENLATFAIKVHALTGIVEQRFLNIRG